MKALHCASFLDLADDLPDLDSADFFKFLEDQDISGDLPLLPDAELPASDAAAQQLVVPGLVCAADAAAPPQQPEATTMPCPPGWSAAAPIVASCFAVSAVQAGPPVQQHHLLPCGRASSSSCSDACIPDSGFSTPGLTAPSPPDSPVSSSEHIPASSSGSVLPDLPATQLALQLTSRSSGGASSSQPNAQAAVNGKQQQWHQQQQQQGDKPLSKQQIAASKRKAPQVDWRSIDDPEERRKQRRLAKNRITAARSRERKKEQLADMEDRLAALETENSEMRTLLARLAQENTRLREQLSSHTSGTAVTAFNTQDAGAEPAVLKCVAIMHLVACLLCVKASLGLMPLLAALCKQWFAQCVSQVAPPVAASSCRAAVEVNGGHNASHQQKQQSWQLKMVRLRACRRWEAFGSHDWQQWNGSCQVQVCCT